MDVLNSKQRSYCMSRIKGKNTKPEVALRKGLWDLGFRYRIKSQLPGKPDIVFPALKVAVFVDGCFWHKCPRHYTSPKTRVDFWERKISGNVERDLKNNTLLESQGWLAIRVWEHDVKNNLDGCVEYIKTVIAGRCKNLIQSRSP